jgi:hypothetical protein
VLVGPDQVAAFWHQRDHVVEATGTAAIAGDIAEGGHEVVLNEASNHMILRPRALVNCPVSSILPNRCEIAKTLSADTGVNLPNEARSEFGFRITCTSIVFMICSIDGSPLNLFSQVGRHGRSDRHHGEDQPGQGRPAAIGSRYGDVLPAEGHLFDLLEPEEVVPAWK